MAASDRLVRLILRWSILGGLPLAAASCTVVERDGATVAVPLSDSMPADTSHVQVALTPEFNPTLPPKKPAGELEKLGKMWEDALAAEQKLLGTQRLRDGMAGLQDFTGADGIPIHGELKDALFTSLNAREYLAYELVHPESWSEDEVGTGIWAGQIQGIARKLPKIASGDQPSERQMEALRKDTIGLKKIVLECLTTNKSVSIPMLRIIAEFKIFPAVGPLVAIYQDQAIKDDLILTTLVQLMEKGMYWDWLKSDPFKAMLIDPDGMAPLSRQNADAIIGFAQAFAAR
jgi:hypothetical protein